VLAAADFPQVASARELFEGAGGKLGNACTASNTFMIFARSRRNRSASIDTLGNGASTGVGCEEFNSANHERSSIDEAKND